jgi:hypothetical protein
LQRSLITAITATILVFDMISCRTPAKGSSGASLIASSGDTTSGKIHNVDLICIRAGGGKDLPTVVINDDGAYLIDDPKGDGESNLTVKAFFRIDIQPADGKANPNKEQVTYSTKDHANDFVLIASPGKHSNHEVDGDITYLGQHYAANCDTKTSSVKIGKN